MDCLREGAAGDFYCYRGATGDAGRGGLRAAHVGAGGLGGRLSLALEVRSPHTLRAHVQKDVCREIGAELSDA